MSQEQPCTPGEPELKPCPFCGSDALNRWIVSDRTRAVKDNEVHGVQCENCGAHSLNAGLWNMRAAPSAIEPCREAIHVLLELKAIKIRMEAGVANEEEKRYYEGNKEGAWIGAAVAFDETALPQDRPSRSSAAVRMALQGRMSVPTEDVGASSHEKPINALAPGERKSGEIAGPLNDSRESARVQSTATGQRDRASQERVSNPVEGSTSSSTRTRSQPPIIHGDGGSFSTASDYVNLSDYRELERELAEEKGRRQRWQKLADQRAIEVADLRTSAPAPSSAIKPTRAAADVLAERQRQVEKEGWTSEHDDGHVDGGMAVAAACYALDAAQQITEEHHTWSERYVAVAKELWPWDAEWWKPKDPRRDLVRAAALIVAEIEKLDRASARSDGKAP